MCGEVARTTKLLHALLAQRLLFLLELLLVVRLQVNEAHGVSQKLKLYLQIERAATAERRRMIDLQYEQTRPSVAGHHRALEVDFGLLW